MATASLDLEAVREIADAELQPYDGQRRLGTILRCGRSFLAFDLEDRHRRTVTNVRDAMRALAPDGAHAG